MIGDLIKPGSVPSDPSPRRRRRRKSLWQSRFVRWSVIGLTIAVVTAALAVFSVAAYYRNKADGYDLGKLAELEKSSVIFDRNGEEIGSFYVMENRRPVVSRSVPLHFINALVAEEDSRF